jgi:hypothetical protein
VYPKSVGSVPLTQRVAPNGAYNWRATTCPLAFVASEVLPKWSPCSHVTVSSGVRIATRLPLK